MQIELEHYKNSLENEKKLRIQLSEELLQICEESEGLKTELEESKKVNTQLGLAQKENQVLKSELNVKEEELKNAINPNITGMELPKLEQLAKKYLEKLNEVHLEISLQKKKEEESKLCIVCYDEEKEYVCVPCGHLVYCKTCSQKADDFPCPVCRSKVTVLTKIFKV